MPLTHCHVYSVSVFPKTIPNPGARTQAKHAIFTCNVAAIADPHARRLGRIAFIESGQDPDDFRVEVTPLLLAGRVRVDVLIEPKHAYS